MSRTTGVEVPKGASTLKRTTFLILAAALVASLLLSLGWGSVSIRADQIVGIMLERAGVETGIEFTRQQSAVLWNIRLPRVLMGVLVGAALALAGAALQVGFRNQLADPTLLGMSGAATVGVALAYIVGAVSLGRWALPLFAVAGALISAYWLMRFSWRHGRSDRLTLVLAGVALQLFLAGVATLLANAFRVPGMPDASVLTMGGLAGTFWRDVYIAAPVVAIATFVLWRMAPVLNILLLGEGTSQALGVKVGATLLYIVTLAGVLTGTVVGYSGTVAFVGLIVPYFLRMLLGDDHRTLLPAALLGGATLVTVADAVARNVIAPMEMPLGVLMTVVGGPLFFWLIGHGRSVGRW